MEVKAKKVFQPIHIVIETEEEAEALWHTLNTSSGLAWSQRNYKMGMSKLRFMDLHYSMWDTYDKMFSPKRDLCRAECSSMQQKEEKDDNPNEP